MYALIESGGQQHKVEPGRYITVDRLAVEEGGAVVFDQVLLVRTDDGVAVGTPAVDGAEVRGTVRRHLRGTKIHGFKYKAKKGYSRRWGARADLTQITIDTIVYAGQTFEAGPQDRPSDDDQAVQPETQVDQERPSGAEVDSDKQGAPLPSQAEGDVDDADTEQEDA